MKGNCLCGAVSIEAQDNHEVHSCHCGTCRKWGGAAGFSVQTQGIQTTGGEHIISYQSSEWGERAFCKTCGTHLYFHQLGTDNYYVYPGLFDGEFTLASQIFIDKKASYCTLADNTPTLTEAEFVAMVTGSKP